MPAQPPCPPEHAVRIPPARSGRGGGSPGRAKHRWLPLIIVATAAVLAGLIILQDLRDVAELRDLIHEENQIRMRSCLEHVQEYFDAVYSTLLFISLDDDVQALRRDSRAYIQKLYDHQWEHHRLTEVYVVERNFSGQQPPFMTFERGLEDVPPEQIHSLAREEEEYRTHREQLRRFADDARLPALLSGEIRLCTPDAQGKMARGFAYSVPIRASNTLTGIVAGMIQTQTILDALRHGQAHQSAFLVNDQGDLIADREASPRAHAWFRDQFATHGVGGFFARADESFPVGRWIALWQPVQIVSGETWWLVYLYNKDAYRQRTLVAGVLGHTTLAVSLLAAGLALAFLVRNLDRRLDEQARHLRERRELERQVGAVSEREQRRMGASLREDLCQRLTGIEAVSRHLEKRLAAAQLPESAFASEIAAELKESLTRARAMAEELQPVTLLEHGFPAAIHKLAANTSRDRGLPCQVEESDFPAALDPTVAGHLYRIAQEAIHNAVRHARATRILIQLAGHPDRLTLTITDDGVGMPADVRQCEGMGLRIMRYRCELIGAELVIRPETGKGTVVSCVWSIRG